MDVRHLATKSFDEVEVKKSIVYQGVPVVINLRGSLVFKDEEDNTNVYEDIFNEKLPDNINAIGSLIDGKELLMKSPIGEIITKNGEVLPLSSIFGYKVSDGDAMANVIPIGTEFDSIFNTVDVQKFLRNVAIRLFPNINPSTGNRDIDFNKYYAPYIPLIALTACVPPQNKDANAFFNPEGTITVAEFLDSINSIKYGCNSNRRRKKTIDNISSETDYFNEGYQSCVRGISSPFFNLYIRPELLKPITRLELAYITVICWEPFINKFNNLYGGDFYLGISFDWEMPCDILNDFKDGFNYKVSKLSVNKDYDIISLNVKDYKSDRTMSEFFEDIKTGAAPIPLPMFMSMLELHILGLFNYEGELNPLKEVSRGELSYFLTKLASLFPSRYNILN